MRVVSDYVDAPARRDFEGTAAPWTADGEADPVVGDVHGRLERAAAA